MTQPQTFLSPFSYPTFRNIWSASIVSNIGGMIQGVGAAWMMTSLTPSENMVALVQTSNTLPVMLFALLAGAIADNYDRRRVMLAAQFFMCAVSFMLAFVALAGLITPWLLLSFTFLIGCGGALNNPSWQAAVGDMVPREEVSGAVSLNSVGFNATRVVGPAVGGAILTFTSPAIAFLINALTYIPTAMALAFWKKPVEVNELPREKMGTAILAGLRYAAMSPNIINVLCRSAVFGFAAVSLLALLPVVARDVIDGGPLTYGIMLGAFGIGAIGGAFANAPVRARLSGESIVRYAFLILAIAATIVGFSTNLVLSCVALFFAGACWVMEFSLFNTTIQLSTPRWVVGRVLSFYATATFGGQALGAWVWGMMAEDHGIAFSLAVSGGTMVIGALMGLIWRMPGLSMLDLSPLNRFRTPELKLDLLPRSGPIVVELEFEVASEDTTDFLKLMIDRRRIRIRDGARHWALMRDLANPDIWTETYHSPTWADYVRHNQRRLLSDSEHFDQVRAITRNKAGPRVRRMIERQAIAPKDEIFNRTFMDNH